MACWGYKKWMQDPGAGDWPVTTGKEDEKRTASQTNSPNDSSGSYDENIISGCQTLVTWRGGI